MSFEEYHCMMKNEDQDDEEYAVCQYPKCWLEDCPHKQARDSLAEADLQGKVRDFHLKFNFTANPTNENPTLIPIELARRRFWLLLKEVDEFEEAMEAEDLIKITDAIGDILYFVYGDAVAYGIPVIPVFNEIHRSNMTKSPCLDKDVRAVKGLDYSPPNFEKILRGVGGDE